MFLSTRLWACGYCGLILDELVGLWVLWTYSRRACGLVGISCGGYSGIVCAVELTTGTIFLLGEIEFQNKSVVLTSNVRFSFFYNFFHEG